MLLLHASYTCGGLLHASYTPLTRPRYSCAYTPRTRLLHASYVPGSEQRLFARHSCAPCKVRRCLFRRYKNTCSTGANLQVLTAQSFLAFAEAALLNHSCAPNCHSRRMGGNMAIFAGLPSPLSTTYRPHITTDLSPQVEHMSLNRHPLAVLATWRLRGLRLPL